MNPNENLFDKIIAAIRGALRVIPIAIAVIGMLAGFSGGAATVINNSMNF